MKKSIKKLLTLGLATAILFGGVNNKCYAAEQVVTDEDAGISEASVGIVYDISGQVGVMKSENISVKVSYFMLDCVGGIGLVANDYCELEISEGNAIDTQGFKHPFSAHGDNVTTCSASGRNKCGNWAIEKVAADVSVHSNTKTVTKHAYVSCAVGYLFECSLK